MAEITRQRTIRISTRAAESTSYKVDTKAVRTADTLIVVIDHESKTYFKRSFEFAGKDIVGKNSIHFAVKDEGDFVPVVTWMGVKPQVKPIKTTYQKFEIDGKLLVSGFSVYVLEIQYARKNYFYIGITGDPVYESARSAFYRLCGHLEHKNKKSTQNQLYKALTKIFAAKTHAECEACIAKTKIVMHSFSLGGFVAPEKTMKASEPYKRLQHEVARVENNVVMLARMMMEKTPERILNKTANHKFNGRGDERYDTVSGKILELIRNRK